MAVDYAWQFTKKNGYNYVEGASSFGELFISGCWLGFNVCK